MDAVDEYIPTPERDVEKTFLMAIEDVFSITGRGTVATGRIERGVVKVGDNVEIVGIRDTQTTTITGIEMFQKTLDEGFAGDNVVSYYVVLHVKILNVVWYYRTWYNYTTYKLRIRSICFNKRRRWSSYTILYRLPSTILCTNN